MLIDKELVMYPLACGKNRKHERLKIKDLVELLKSVPDNSKIMMPVYDSESDSYIHGKLIRKRFNRIDDVKSVALLYTDSKDSDGKRALCLTTYDGDACSVENLLRRSDVTIFNVEKEAISTNDGITAHQLLGAIANMDPDALVTIGINSVHDSKVVETFWKVTIVKLFTTSSDKHVLMFVSIPSGYILNVVSADGDEIKNQKTMFG